HGLAPPLAVRHARAGRSDPHRHPTGRRPLGTLPLPEPRRRRRGRDRWPRTPEAGVRGMGALSLDGLVAIVTGGASGIGAAIARRLHSEGAQIAVLDRDISGADAAFAAFTADVSDRASVDAAVAAVAEKFGRIDIVINNAGIGAQGDVAGNDDDEWARVLSINVTGIARVTSAALPWLRQSPSAAVCNTSSIVSTTGLPERALYSASKGAVSALTRAMAADHLREGIRVNAVNPGTADTPDRKSVV